jgi:hypothetical protein
MTKRWVLLSCVLFLGSTGNLAATPLDSLDIVYVNGLPCNSLCQSYMAWSRQSSSTAAQAISAQPLPKAVVRREMAIRGERSRAAADARVAKQGAANSRQAAPNSNEMPRARLAGLQPKDAGPQPKGNAAADSEPTQAKNVDPRPAAGAANTSEAAQARIADTHPTDDAAAASNARTLRNQVTAATAVAERITVATAAPEPKADNADRSHRGETVPPRDADMTASAAAIDPDLLVALVMARPEMKSVSDLANKNIAIDGEPSASNGSVRTAIVAAGAAEVQLSKGEAKAIDRLIAGEVPAAVLTLVSPEAAEAFPDIAGFRIFRIPLSPKAPL